MRVGTGLEEIVRYNEARGEYGQGQFDTLLDRLSAPERRDRPDVYERRRPDGTMLEVSTSPLPSGGFVAAYTDVTERYRAAAALREANEALEARVGERTLALSAAKAEAERANVGKTRFLAAAGHDLMQPLQAARLFLSALAERNPDHAVAQIDASLNSVEHLLGELVEVSKLDSGVTTPSFADFRLAEVLKPLAEEFSALAGAQGLAFRAMPCSAAVRSDPALLRRILQNFLANALRYTVRGRILLGCRRRGRDVVVEVWDTGPGIPEGKLRDIFLEFHRLEQGKGRGEGLGLGLAIVERLAGLMGHAVDVRSRPGRGSCFSVRLPVATAPAASVAPGVRAQRRFDGALVVFVENEAAIAGAMVELLAGWSCEVVAAPDRRGRARPPRRPPPRRAAQRLPSRRRPHRPRGAGAAARPARPRGAGGADHRRPRSRPPRRRRGSRLPAAAQAGPPRRPARAPRAAARRARQPGGRIAAPEVAKSVSTPARRYGKSGVASPAA